MKDDVVIYMAVKMAASALLSNTEYSALDQKLMAASALEAAKKLSA